MSEETDRSRMPAPELVKRCRAEMVPLSNRISYFTAMPMAEEDLRQYLHDPIAALPPSILAAIPKIGILLVPFLEKGNGKQPDMVCYERPSEHRASLTARIQAGDTWILLFSTRELEVADYHYQFYNVVASLIADSWPPDVQEPFYRILREELGSEMHGEVDEKSWHLKQALLRRQANARKETKLFRDYARQAFEDTLTLYLHGTCCDIDVETGPRQMPSRYLRRRIESLMSIYPPPEGYAVLPEQLKSR